MFKLSKVQDRPKILALWVTEAGRFQVRGFPGSPGYKIKFTKGIGLSGCLVCERFDS